MVMKSDNKVNKVSTGKNIFNFEKYAPIVVSEESIFAGIVSGAGSKESKYETNTAKAEMI